MEGLKRILTEKYDNNFHIDEPPYGVQSYPLFDGKLFTSDEYKWILVNNFGVPILTDASYSKGDLGSNKYSDEDVLKHIERLLKYAEFSNATKRETEEICRLLSGEINTQDEDTWGMRLSLF